MEVRDEVINVLMDIKHNVERSGLMLAPDVIRLINMLAVELKENIKKQTQLEHAWLNSGEYISGETVLN